MANPYLTPAQLFMLFDVRAAQQMSGDKNAPQGDPSTVQFICDVCASEVDSTLNGRVPLPLATPVPSVLTLVTAKLAQFQMYGRRTAAPKEAKALYDEAKQWLVDFRNGVVTLPGVAPAEPTLQDSDFTDGRSRFDYVYGQRPRCTGPTHP